MKIGDTIRIEAVPTKGCSSARRAKRTGTLKHIVHNRVVLDLGGLVGTREFRLSKNLRGHSYGGMRDWRIEPDQLADLDALAKELESGR